MRLLVVASCLIVAPLAHAGSKAVAPSAPAEGRPSPEAMMRLARTAVLRDLKLHGNASDRLGPPRVTSVRLGDRSDGKTLRPITGYGIIHVMVEQAAQPGSAAQRLVRPFSKYAKREFAVVVDRDGEARVLTKGWSQTLVGRLGRSLRNGPGRLVSSIKENPNAKKIATGVAVVAGAAALTLASGGSGAVALLGMKVAIAKIFGGTAIAAATKTVGIYQEGRAEVKKELGARAQAFADTVAWARQPGESGAFPTLDESYQHYTSLRPRQGVVRSYTLGGFAEALEAHGL
jgi:hypothetical protein